MTREEIEKLIINAKRRPVVFASGELDDMMWQVPNSEMNKLLALATLGASVAAPRDDEIEAMALEIANRIRRDYGLPTVRELPIDAASNELRRQARAALSALRESKP